MTSVRRNILSNVCERVCSTALTLMLIPIQVRILGMETYGLLGFIASLQVILNVLDFGLTPTVIREVAADGDARRETSQAVVRTFATAYWAIAVGIGGVLVVGARWLTFEWLRLGALKPEEVILAIQLLAVSVALRWPVSLYAGILSGLRRLDVLNLIRICGSVLRLLGGVGVILVTRSLTSYLVWLGFSAVLELVLYVMACSRLAPGLSVRPGFSGGAVRRIWRFSLGMNAISILTLVFTQSDRLLISKLLPMEALGYYSVAWSLVMGLSVIENVVTTALFPALARDMALRSAEALSSHHANGAQLLMYLVSLPASVLIFYGHDLVRLWISASVADASWRVVAILAIGFLLNAAVSMSYTLSIASGYMRPPLVVNAVGALFYLPLLYVLVRQFGIEGAAWAWLAVNGYFVVTLLPWVQTAVAKEKTISWVRQNVAPFVCAALIFVGGARLVSGNLAGHGALWAGSVGIVGVGLYVVAGFLCCRLELRRSVVMQLRGRPLRESLPAA